MSYNQLNGGAAALAKAETQTGVPYVYGGKTPGVGFDCSGLTMWSYSTVGVSLPRTTEEQFQIKRIYSVPYEPGDLVFYEGTRPGPHGEPGHVGLYVGIGTIVGALQHVWNPTPTGAPIMFNAPWTGDLGGLRYDFVSFPGPVVAHTRPALLLPKPSPEDNVTIHDVVVKAGETLAHTTIPFAKTASATLVLERAGNVITQVSLINVNGLTAVAVVRTPTSEAVTVRVIEVN